MSKIRANIYKNGDLKNGKIVVIPRLYQEILKNGKNKLRINKPTRIFDTNGIELFKEDIENLKENEQYSFVISSNNADFIGDKKKVLTVEERVIGDLKNISTIDPIVDIIAKESFIDDEAVKQLYSTSKSLANVRYAIGMPDLHPGKGFPIGTAFATESVIYPHLIGGDIGCGMLFVDTNLNKNKSKPEKWIKKLYLDGEWEGDVSNFLKTRNIEETDFDKKSLGTIGGGNHFAELQEIYSIEDEIEAKKLNLNLDNLYLLVHSGSRGYGQSILEKMEKSYGVKGLVDTSKEAKEYLKEHSNACDWAKANRELIGKRFLNCILNEEEEKEIDLKKILDIWHNNVVLTKFKDGNEFWLHRKGAAPNDQGPIVIPGSRGDFSYLVIGNEENLEKSCYSVAHGAGRRWKRSKSLEIGKNDSNLNSKSLSKTEKFSSHVICEDKQLLYEEMPKAYKSIEGVIKDLVDLEIIRVIAIMKPVITYKTRK